MVVVDGNFLCICNGIICFYLFWYGFVFYLIIIGELYKLFGCYLGILVDVVLDGYYVYVFSGMKIS